MTENLSHSVSRGDEIRWPRKLRGWRMLFWIWLGRCPIAARSAISIEQRLRRARSPAKKERWQAAMEFWKELSDFFGDRIKTQCGEPF